MSQTAIRAKRARESGPDKFEARRAELAEATLHTLAELGYARTSLREIAQNSEFSHGVLHYYFADKVDLIAHAVRQYEDVCVTRYDEVVAGAEDAEQLYAEFADTFFTTLEVDAEVHRLWYDVRNQSLFDDAFRVDVIDMERGREQMIWRVISRYAELCGREPVGDSTFCYVLVDGIFQRALLHRIAGDDAEVARARDWLREAFALLV